MTVYELKEEVEKLEHELIDLVKNGSDRDHSSIRDELLTKVMALNNLRDIVLLEQVIDEDIKNI